MPTTIQIPPLGESITEAVIAAWLKPDGSYVQRDEEIIELETDKVTMPLPSPAAGLLKHAATQGATVKVGAVIGSIDESATAPPDAPPSPPSPRPAHDTTTDIRATPLAKKIAEERGIDLAAIRGTGPGGKVTEKDLESSTPPAAPVLASSPRPGPVAPVLASSPRPGPAAPVLASSPRPGPARREPMSQLRQRIAARLVESQNTAAMLTTFNECDMSKVMDLRARHKDAFEKQHAVKLGFMSFFVKACVSALRKVPVVNAFIVDDAGVPAIEYHDSCDIAVAVGTPKGLVVPVLRGCENMSMAEIEAGINALAAKARDGKLTLDDLQGGTFTISNGGVYGSMMSTPILNPPQSGILGMHNIIRRPIENPDKPASGEVVVRPMMYLALSYDHRIVDGQGAVTFLKHVKECIEEPERMVIGV